MKDLIETAMSAKTPLAIVGLFLILIFFALKFLGQELATISPRARARLLTVVVIGALAVLALAIGLSFNGYRPDAPSRDPVASSPADSATHLITRNDMPCRWAWIFLGRFSNIGKRYEVKEAFRYADGSVSHGPIPRPGNSIITTSPRTLIISNFAEANEGHKCEGILEPPASYRPETESQFKAGVLPVNSQVTVNLIQLLPSAQADPTYVWALVGPEN